MSDEHARSTELPIELELEILLRLPIRSIVTSLRVRRAWLHLVTMNEHVISSHISRSAPCLVVFDEHVIPGPYTVYEIADEDSHQNGGNCINRLFSFRFVHDQELHSSVHGLIFFRRNNLCICNPITRDYRVLPQPQTATTPADTFGFGVSSSNEYKIVRICRDSEKYASSFDVYTLGTGLWRAGQNCPKMRYIADDAGVYLKGFLYWIVEVPEGHHVISSFNLETEVFGCSFLFTDGEPIASCELGVYDKCLCICITNYMKNQLTCFDLDNWTERIVVSTMLQMDFIVSFPTAVYSNLDTVFVVKEDTAIKLRSYRNLPNTIPESVTYPLCTGFWSSYILFYPSFRSCRSFQSENVGIFDDGAAA